MYIKPLFSDGTASNKKNPSDSVVSSDYTSSTNSHDLYTFLNYPNHISTVHYNVQSIRYKLDLILAEFSQFDIISFTETWLSGKCPTSDLIFPSYYAPERKDRISDRYGGVMVYIKDSISYIRRNYLEINGLECIWVQTKMCNKRNILYGNFYRSPNADFAYYSLIEDSIGPAMDSNISNVVITSDFNINQLNSTSSKKISSLCSQFNICQPITEPTHFTENSSSLTDLLFVTNKESVLTSGVGEPCLDNSIRYHCPVFVVFNFLKPKRFSVRHVIWKYDQGNYSTLRNYLNGINWVE